MLIALLEVCVVHQAPSYGPSIMLQALVEVWGVVLYSVLKFTLEALSYVLREVDLSCWKLCGVLLEVQGFLLEW